MINSVLNIKLWGFIMIEGTRRIELETLPTAVPVNGADKREHINDKARHSRLYLIAKFAQSIILRPVATTVKLGYRVIKLVTWVTLKAAVYKVAGKHTKASTFFAQEYLKTVKAVRDILFLPSVAKRALLDVITPCEDFVDDIKRKPVQEYLKVQHTKGFEQFSSCLHGCETFEVIYPKIITEFPAASDPTLQTVMASNFIESDMIAINFGTPNVASFITEKKDDGTIQTLKVDAKSLYRDSMTFHPTSGKIQSGVFLVPTNLPQEALKRFADAARTMEGRKDITCVNTNCRVLQEAGFSIEGVVMDDIVFPNTLMEHLLFRNVLYTDTNGLTHKVHFDILNTSKLGLEKYFESVDTAVIGTRLRHSRRHADTDEDKKSREATAKALIEQERERLAAAQPPLPVVEGSDQRKISVSVPSFLGNIFAKFWGRHTIYEMDLSDKQDEIFKAFQDLALQSTEDKMVKLHPFPQEKPSFVTRLKRDIFFSKPVIWFLRSQMIGRHNEIDAQAQTIFEYIKAAPGEHFNYALVDNKIVLAKVYANSNSEGVQRRVADWALSKHALLANRQAVYCSGELWYDETANRVKMNQDSGTYVPTLERVGVAAELANRFFQDMQNGTQFEAINVA